MSWAARSRVGSVMLGAIFAALSGCAHAVLKGEVGRVSLPLAEGTTFRASNENVAEESWNFFVPYGTPVLAVADGEVTVVRARGSETGCDPKFKYESHYLVIKHSDGTRSRYDHLDPYVKVGQRVKKASKIALTSPNGFLCEPTLGFRMSTPDGAPVSLRFDGYGSDGRLHSGQDYKVSTQN